jgi:hypothetical protein
LPWTIACAASKFGRIPETENSQPQTSEMLEHSLKWKERAGVEKSGYGGAFLSWSGLSAHFIVID